MQFHFDTVQNIGGFAASNAIKGETFKIVTRDMIISDDPLFYTYTEQISNIFLNEKKIFTEQVYQFLIVIHSDLSADLHVNDFPVNTEIRVKRAVEKGELISQDNVADIRNISFPSIKIIDTDRIIYCFKVGWRFGLFFDLTALSVTATHSNTDTKKLDLNKISRSIGDLRRYLYFYHVYKTLESTQQFDDMQKDGWFPFVEILADDYKKLSATYENKHGFNEKMNLITDKFNKERIEKISDKWWNNTIFSSKKSLMQAGINAYLQNNDEGFINCIKNLTSEIEGILRALYLSETGKGNNVKTQALISCIIDKAKSKSGEDSLLLPLPFLNYLQHYLFANFNVETGEIDLSRNSSGHGVAKSHQYTKSRAIQMILILDQIYYCI